MVNCDAKSFTRLRALHHAGSTYALKFDLAGWTQVDKDPVQWRISRDHGYTNAEIFFHNRPCHDSVFDQSRFRDVSRIATILEDGALISADLVTMRGAAAGRCITKLPQKPAGMNYCGVLIIPFEDCHVTISVTCRDDGLAGFRDTAVYTEMSASSKVIERWQQDPYDSTVNEHLMRNLSEDERYDKHFPEHPLTRVRKYLREFGRSFRFDHHKLEQPMLAEPWIARVLRPVFQ
ncbi:MAG TPA: hypothetical protein V6C81_11210 [Planktothrix sp.]|jgi:hypothetical protein